MQDAEATLDVLGEQERALIVAQKLFRYVYGTREERAPLGNGAQIMVDIYRLQSHKMPPSVGVRARAETMAAPAQDGAALRIPSPGTLRAPSSVSTVTSRSGQPPGTGKGSGRSY